MKRFDYIFLTILTAGLLTACAEKKKSDVIIAPKPAAKVKNKPVQKMGDYEQRKDVAWLGSTYQVCVKRQSDTGLPVVKNDGESRYYDNKITVRILRKDGSEFFNRTFTKTNFADFLDKHTQETGALLGIVYVKAEGDYLFFAASVGSPDVASDEYVPMVLQISRMGTVSISKDQLLDTGSDDSADKREKSSSPDKVDEDDGV